MGIPAIRMFDILGVPKATAEKKVAAGERIKGNGGRAALDMARLPGFATGIVINSKAPQTKDFDTAKSPGHGIERPQRARLLARPDTYATRPRPNTSANSPTPRSISAGVTPPNPSTNPPGAPAARGAIA